jgi:hypothetical protein
MNSISIKPVKSGEEGVIVAGELVCPKCNKGYISAREYKEDQFIDYDVAVMDNKDNVVMQTLSAYKRDGAGNIIYKPGKEPKYEKDANGNLVKDKNGKLIVIDRGDAETISWQEPLMDKIFVLSSTSFVHYDFCSNVLCDWENKKLDILETFEC